MLLHLLDTPYYAPQTMAFAIARDDLAAYREGVRAVVEHADVRPFSELHRPWTPRRRPLAPGWLDRMTDEIEKAADIVGLERPVRLTATELPMSTIVRLGEATGVVAFVEAYGAEDEGLALVARSQVGVLLDALADPEPEPESAWGGPYDVGWAAALSADEEEEHFTARQQVRSYTGYLSALEGLVGWELVSRGPGPFLPPPPGARWIEDPSWKKLPLFVGDHWDLPFCKVKSLEGDELLEAIEASTLPDRAWHASYAVRKISDDGWAEMVEEHWPRCRDRYVDLLTTCHRDDRAVVFLENVLDHAIWPGVLD